MRGCKWGESCNANTCMCILNLPLLYVPGMPGHCLNTNLNLESSAHARTSDIGLSHDWVLMVPLVYENV